MLKISHNLDDRFSAVGAGIAVSDGVRVGDGAWVGSGWISTSGPETWLVGVGLRSPSFTGLGV